MASANGPLNATPPGGRPSSTEAGARDTSEVTLAWFEEPTPNAEPTTSSIERVTRTVGDPSR